MLSGGFGFDYELVTAAASAAFDTHAALRAGAPFDLAIRPVSFTREHRRFVRVSLLRLHRWRFTMGRGILLWLIGIPIPIILLIWLLGGLHG
jgi:hypothetical protein